ncbi:MAG: hypothetical protein Q8P40_11410, partial [Nitrospirota bacterium]|nr:hypothetical protein [Nitrospirota bacterium]
KQLIKVLIIVWTSNRVLFLCHAGLSGIFLDTPLHPSQEGTGFPIPKAFGRNDINTSLSDWFI